MSGGPSISVRGALLRIDHECQVSITSVNDGECIEQLSSENSTTFITTSFTKALCSSQNSTESTPAIIGGTVVALTLIIAVLVFVLVLMFKCRHRISSIPPTNSE